VLSVKDVASMAMLLKIARRGASMPTGITTVIMQSSALAKARSYTTGQLEFHHNFRLRLPKLFQLHTIKQ
jgi:hypothetical protein